MTDFKLASFNVENLGGEAPGFLEKRLPLLRPQLQRLDADILCLQEVNATRVEKGKPRSFGALDVLLKDTPYEGYHRAWTHQEGKDEPRDVHNLVVLSRYPTQKVKQYAHDLVPPVVVELAEDLKSEDPRTTARFERPLLHVTVEVGGAVLHILNLHLRAPSGSFLAGQKSAPYVWKSVRGWAEAYYISSIKRAGQALEARLLVDRIFDEDPGASVVVCGDFNAEEDEVPLKILMAADEDTGDGRLAQRSLVALERSLPEDRVFSVIHRGRKQMLDHLLVSHELLGGFRSMEIHNETLSDEAYVYENVEHSAESFHAPLVAHFVIK